MFPQRNLLRLSQRSAQQLRATPVRSAVQRRLNSTDAKMPSWAVDNEFNRERANVKHHAASTSGTCTSVGLPIQFLRCFAWSQAVILTQWL